MELDRPYLRDTAYYKTAAWKAKREAVLARAKGRCERRGCSNRARHVHHKTYRHFGDEPLEDLQALCRLCHELRHPGRVLPRLSREILKAHDCEVHARARNIKRMRRLRRRRAIERREERARQRRRSGLTRKQWKKLSFEDFAVRARERVQREHQMKGKGADRKYGEPPEGGQPGARAPETKASGFGDDGRVHGLPSPERKNPGPAEPTAG